MTDVETAELTTPAEWREAFPVLGQLRDGYDEAAYLDALRSMRGEGYRLFARRSGGEIVAVAGAAVRTNLYDGRHAFVYDLVTDRDHRSRGHGGALLSFVEDWARGRDCGKVVLASGLWRGDAHRFYEDRMGMERVCYEFTKEL